MTSTTKQLINKSFQTILILLFLFAAVIAIVKMFKSLNDNYKVATQSQSINDKKIDLSQTKIWQDKYNQTHLELQRTKVDKATMQVYTDSLAHILKIRSKQIQSLIKIKSNITIDQKLNITPRFDTITTNGSDLVSTYSSFEYKDKWIEIQGDFGKTDSIHIKGSDTLTKTDYWKKKWFLGKRHYYSDFSNKNPHIKIVGLKQVEVQAKQTNWSIGPCVNIGYPAGDFSRAQFSVGVSLQYNVIKF